MCTRRWIPRWSHSPTSRFAPTVNSKKKAAVKSKGLRLCSLSFKRDFELERTTALENTSREGPGSFERARLQPSRSEPLWFGASAPEGSPHDRPIPYLTHARLTLSLEAIPSLALVSHSFRHLQQCCAGVRQVRFLPINQAQFARQLQFLDWNRHQFAAG